MSTKPIRVMCGGLSNRIFAVRRYTQRGDLVISSAKDDVTADVIKAVAEHRLACQDTDCRCGWSTTDWLNAANQVA
jgi:hypothetical protein